MGSGTGPASPQRRLRILNTKKKSNICELTFPTAVLSVKLNRKRLVVVLLDQIYIYDISCMKLLHTIETSPNPRALCDLSSCDESILVYPTPVGMGVENSTHSPGQCVLFDALNVAPLNVVSAHRSELAVLALNSTGTLLATASTKGTVVRVFSVVSGGTLGQYRRGSYPAAVNSVAFDLGSHLLAVASETGTIHVFKMGDDEDDEPAPRRVSITDRVIKTLPRGMTSILEPQRDFAYVKCPTTGERHTVGFSAKDVLVASDDALLVYSIPQGGGECVLVKEYPLT